MDHNRHPSALRRFLHGQSSAGIVLMATAALALVIANSSLGPGYESRLDVHIGPLSVRHWINDGLMAVFFLLVGLEIKREKIDGQLASWSRRALPAIAAFGGMAVPALIYLAFNRGATAHGWAIPAATDIAFALGVLSLLGKRVPASLRIFLTALAIIDDLGAVIIIATVYTADLSLANLAGAATMMAVLIGLNRFRVRRLTPYLMIGVLLWVFMLRSGIHATLAGVLLALAIPLQCTPGRPDQEKCSPVHRLEHLLHIPVGFLVLPIFGLANAGVPLFGLRPEALISPVPLGVALGLLVGKLIGVFGFSMLAIRLRLADMPAHASVSQMAGRFIAMRDWLHHEPSSRCSLSRARKPFSRRPRLASSVGRCWPAFWAMLCSGCRTAMGDQRLENIGAAPRTDRGPPGCDRVERPGCACPVPAPFRPGREPFRFPAGLGPYDCALPSPGPGGRRRAADPHGGGGDARRGGIFLR